MSTRATIGYVDSETGNIVTTFCHFDGYFEHTGKILNEYYTDLEKVKALINLGPINQLQANVFPTGEHSDKNRETGVTVFKIRDMEKDVWQNLRTVETFNKGVYVDDRGEKELGSPLIQCLVYIFKDGKWLFFDNYNSAKDSKAFQKIFKE